MTSSTPASQSAGRWQFWLGLGFSLFFLWLALREVNLPETLRLLQRLNGWLLCAAFFNSLLSIVARALRWQELLAARQRPAFGRTFSALAVGLMANTFFPARLGDFARAYLLGEAQAESKAYLLGSIVLEKLADLLFLLFSLLILFSQINFPAWLAAPAQATAALILVILPLFALLLWQKNAFLRAIQAVLARFLPAWQPTLTRPVQRLLNALEAIRHPRVLLSFWGGSFLVWAVSVFTNALTLWALGMRLPWWVSIFLLAILQVGVLVPSSPGRVGVFQYIVILGLSAVAVPKDQALGYSLVLYLVVYLPVVGLGLIYLWREKAAWRKMTLLFQQTGRDKFLR